MGGTSTQADTSPYFHELELPVTGYFPDNFPACPDKNKLSGKNLIISTNLLRKRAAFFRALTSKPVI